MRINLITSLTGYPYGTANAKRINLIGKSILLSGHDFRVFTNGIQYNKFNKEQEGIFQDIRFQYLHKKVIKPGITKIGKIGYFLLGCFNLLKLVAKLDRTNDLVYSYNHGNWFNIYIIILCKLFNIKIVQEINEWYHNDLNRKFEKLVIEGPLVKKSDGAIVISTEIEKKVLAINPRIQLIKIPVLEEFPDFREKSKPKEPEVKYCFWMGDVDGYLNDVLFIIEACAKLKNAGFPLKFFISGPFSDETSNRIQHFSEKQGYPFQDVKLLGFVSDEELEEYQNNAFLFIVPLWDSERSRSRFPTKIASFVKAGKPIVTCNIGEMGEMFTHKENILFYREGNSEDLAEKVKILFNDKEKYASIVEKSYELTSKKLNCKTYSKDLKLFFNKL